MELEITQEDVALARDQTITELTAMVIRLRAENQALKRALQDQVIPGINQNGDGQ